MNTSLRSHGKWGDFLVALIPLAWCGNILVNSNFILRMIEWQNESTLFTVRIQGKQWYWVYKFNADTNYKLHNVYYNVGNNNWMKTTAPSNAVFNYNNSILNFVYDYEFKQIHRTNMSKVKARSNPMNLYSLYGNIRKTKEINPDRYYTLNNYVDITKGYKQVNFMLNKNKIGYNFNSASFLKLHNTTMNYFNSIKPTTYRFSKNTALNNLLEDNLKQTTTTFKNTLKNRGSGYIKNKNVIDEVIDRGASFHKRKIRKNRQWRLRIPETPTEVIRMGYLFANNQFNLFDYTDDHNYRGGVFEADNLDVLHEPSETTRLRSAKYPVRLVKGILNKHNLSILKTETDLTKAIFFNYRVNKHDVALKPALVEPFWGFRQKRYKKMRYFSFPLHPKYNSITYTYVRNFLNNQPIKTYRLYTAIKNNKYKNELMPVTLARRLLRTKRTLILPAHINITLITNSYDVIHSWFVPGLGLKIDCVPGRSTHHTLYIDNIGFYYGQCAEICGRYHHHMPIRVCAIHYEHFMLWWQTKGMPRLYRSKTFMKNKNFILEKFKY